MRLIFALLRHCLCVVLVLGLCANRQLPVANAQAGPMPTPVPTAVTPTSLPADTPSTKPQTSPLPQAETPPSWQPPLVFEKEWVQGDVTLDLSVQGEVLAGGIVTYVVHYQNVSAVAQNNITIDLNILNFGTNGNMWQSCLANCDPTNVQGPDVTQVPPPSNVSKRYTVAGLAAGQQGEFAVGIRVATVVYPQTDRSITRLATSGRLYLNNNLNVIVSDDTADSLVVGPVLKITQSRLLTESIYSGEVATFTLLLGNATGALDVVNGNMRADARTATRVLIDNQIPKGAAFVSATGNYTVSSTHVTWTLASLAPGAVHSVSVVFRKIDLDTTDVSLNTRMINDFYCATSDEYPFASPGKRNNVCNQSGSILVNVIQPIKIAAISGAPPKIYFGNTTLMSLTVENYYPAPVSGLVLSYTLPPNFRYAGTPPGALTPISAPTNYGGHVLWQFDMGVGSKTMPMTRVITFTAQAAFTESTVMGLAKAMSVVAPSLALTSTFLRGGPEATPRMIVEKVEASLAQWSPVEQANIVLRNELFNYVITFTNRSVSNVVGLILTDTLPSDFNGNLIYEGGAQLDGVPREPDVLQNGLGGRLIWRNVSVAAGQTVRITYALRVDGYDFYTYCNKISGGLGSEQVEIGAGRDKVCVKISPKLLIEKTANKTAANPGEEVKFNLLFQNLHTQTVTASLYDELREFNFVRQESGYDTPVVTPYGRTDLNIAWPLVTLAPGESIAATIVVTMPNPCPQTILRNEKIIRYRQVNGFVGTIVLIPRMFAEVRCNNFGVSVRKDVSKDTISLGEEVTFTLSLKNESPTQSASGIVISDVMPLGFEYLRLTANSTVRTQPSTSILADGRVMLNWSLNSLAPAAQSTVEFAARGSASVGNYANWGYISVANAFTECKGSCGPGVTDEFSETVAIARVAVQPLITISPKITPDTCAAAGQLLTYRLSIINTNSRAYDGVVVTTTLPLGLRYTRVLSTTPVPQMTVDTNGNQILRWESLQIARPTAVFSQRDLLIEVQAGNLFGVLTTAAQAFSSAGLIPRKDDVSDPSVSMCAPPAPAVAKLSSVMTMTTGNELVYLATVVNPSASTLTTNLRDVLPVGFEFLSFIEGANAQLDANNQLLWSSMSVPPNSVVRMAYRLRGNGNNSVYTNTILAEGSSVLLDVSRARAPVFVKGAQRKLYLPGIRKN